MFTNSVTAATSTKHHCSQFKLCNQSVMSAIAIPNNTNQLEIEEEISKENTKEIAINNTKKSSWWIVDAFKFIYDLPFTSIVRYVYKKEPIILFTVITSNWIIPPTIELFAPWWLVPHSILSEYLTLQQDLNNQLNVIDLTSISMHVIYKIVGLTLYYSSLRTCLRYANGRINLRLRMLMRRLIMEKIVYSEIGALQNAYSSTLGYPIDPRQLERQIMRDLNSSINVIFEQIPNTFTHSSRLCRNAYSLYNKRDKLDYILIVYVPIFCVTYLKNDRFRYKKGIHSYINLLVK